jgi:hypothetical protein
MSTYKNTNNCLLFFTPKAFLDSVDTIFNYRFVESKDNKWVLEFRPIGDLVWQRKPVSVCLATNQIVFHEENHSYNLVPKETNIEEDVHILKIYYLLHELLVDTLAKPELILPEHKFAIDQLKIFPPYNFSHCKFDSWLQQPGLNTLRISNASFKDNYANIYMAFNNWKYIQLLKRETKNKKRKLESDVPNEVSQTETEKTVQDS